MNSSHSHKSHKILRKVSCLALTGVLTLTAVPSLTVPIWAADVTAGVSVGDFTDADFDILANMIGAVETGNQVYGSRDYSTYLSKADSIGMETTITIGWCSCYGANATKLMQMIYDADPSLFSSIDTDGSIYSMLSKDWVKLGWEPTAAQRKTIIALMTTDMGKACQDQMFKEMAESLVQNCQNNYTTNHAAIIMYVELGMLGGEGAAERVFDQVEEEYNGYFSMDAIMAVLKEDQDASSDSEVLTVSNSLYDSRHQFFYDSIKEHVSDAMYGLTGDGTSSTASSGTQTRSGTGNGANASSTGNNAQTEGTATVFQDVQDAETYYFEPVYWAYRNQIVSGTDSTTFSPKQTSTRAQIITMLYNRYGNGEIASPAPFDDVQPSDYYYNAVNWAYAHSITGGFTASSFAPGEPCSRAQILVLLQNCLGLTDTAYVTSSFYDVPAGSWYSSAVEWAVSSGITSGTGNGYFSPGKSCSRAEAVTFLYRCRDLQ